MFKHLVDDSSTGDRSIFPSITYVPIFVFANKYNDSLPVLNYTCAPPSDLSIHFFLLSVNIPVEFFHASSTH